MTFKLGSHSASGELARIQSIARHIRRPSPRIHIGIGDDAAACEPTHSKELLLCTDAMVEGVHFDLAFATLNDIGHKALACALSDIAAMNGRARYAMFSLAIPKSLPLEALDAFYEAASQLAHKYDVDIVGGDLTASRGGIFVDAICVGETDRAISRAGARPGDWVAVSGHPGASAAGLAALKIRERSQIAPALVNAHLRPVPRFDLLPALNQIDGLCTSLIDVSDGISSELHHIAESSRVGFAIESRLLPLHADAVNLGRELNVNPLEWTLSGGEDYELLATLDPTKVKALGGAPAGFTIIGQATPADHGVCLLANDGQRHALKATGYDHFASS